MSSDLKEQMRVKGIRKRQERRLNMEEETDLVKNTCKLNAL